MYLRTHGQPLPFTAALRAACTPRATRQRDPSEPSEKAWENLFNPAIFPPPALRAACTRRAIRNLRTTRTSPRAPEPRDAKFLNACDRFDSKCSPEPELSAVTKAETGQAW